jgi:glycosyltransferase involved in cell wall biosynthesis
MKLCLVMIGRFERKDGFFYADRKNINAIERYLKYFDEIQIVARETKLSSSLYPRQKVDCRNGRISFNLFEELDGIKNIYQYIKKFRNKLIDSIRNSDYVLCWAEPKSNLVVKLAKKENKPCIVYVGGCNKDILLSSKSIARKIAGYWIYYSNKKAINNANYVHYVTNSELQKRYPTKGRTIGASYVNIKTNISEHQKAKRMRLYNGESEKISLGIIGYLNEVKGIDTAIKAVSKLDGRFNLRILGGGDVSPYRDLAKEYDVVDRVHFEGTLQPGEEVLNWLDNIDLYLQPSRTEGLPRATIEAMSRGCPVISSNAMGLVELVEEQWRHNPSDWTTLSRLVDKLANDPVKLRENAERSFNIAQRYNRTLLDESIDLFFKEILSSNIGTIKEEG